MLGRGAVDGIADAATVETIEYLVRNTLELAREPIVFVLAQEAPTGFDTVVGHLTSPLETFLANPDDVTASTRLDVAGFEAARADGEVQLVDVRQPGETAAGTIEGAIEIPLTRLNERLASLDASKPTIVYCAGGYRSSIAASLLREKGFEDVSDLIGGYAAWAALQPTG